MGGASPTLGLTDVACCSLSAAFAVPTALCLLRSPASLRLRTPPATPNPTPHHASPHPPTHRAGHQPPRIRHAVHPGRGHTLRAVCLAEQPSGGCCSPAGGRRAGGQPTWPSPVRRACNLSGGHDGCTGAALHKRAPPTAAPVPCCCSGGTWKAVTGRTRAAAAAGEPPAAAGGLLHACPLSACLLMRRSGASAPFLLCQRLRAQPRVPACGCRTREEVVRECVARRHGTATAQRPQQQAPASPDAFRCSRGVQRAIGGSTRLEELGRLVGHAC